MITIEQELLSYLNNLNSIPELKQKVYFSKVPTGVKMPWAVLTSPGGMREVLTTSLMEETTAPILYIDSADIYQAHQIAYKVVDALENYRGSLGGLDNVHIRCGSPRDLGTFLGGYRQLVTLYIKRTFDRKQPNN